MRKTFRYMLIMLMCSSFIMSSADPFFTAVASGDVGRMQEALKQGIQINSRNGSGSTALHEAAANGHVEMAKALIRAKAGLEERNNRGMTPLVVAAYEGKDNVVDELIAAHANVNIEVGGQVPLCTAIALGHRNIAEKLISAGANVNIGEPFRPLMQAVINGDESIVGMLINAGAQINFKDERGNSVLHWLKPRSDEIAKLLIYAGADVNAKNFAGKTPLEKIVEAAVKSITANKKIPVIGVLINAGAEIPPKIANEQLIKQAMAELKKEKLL